MDWIHSIIVIESPSIIKSCAEEEEMSFFIPYHVAVNSAWGTEVDSSGTACTC